MPRTKLTCRKVTCGFLPARVVEHPVEARNPDGYEDWKLKRREEERAEEEQREEQPQEEPEEQPQEEAEEEKLQSSSRLQD